MGGGAMGGKKLTDYKISQFLNYLFDHLITIIIDTHFCIWTGADKAVDLLESSPSADCLPCIRGSTQVDFVWVDGRIGQVGGIVNYWCQTNRRSSSVWYFSFQPVLHDWCTKSRGLCYPVCGMVHIKEPLLLIDKSSLCGGSGFPFSLSEWSLTICLTPYNRR